jgi:membrane protease YdiL (CAAX protease family)
MTTIASRSFKDRMHWVFMGPDGIRAGWSIVIFLLIIMIPAGLLNLAAHHIFHIKPRTPPKELQPVLTLVMEAVTCLFILAAMAVMGWIERRRLGAYGLPWGQVGYKFAIGWGGGFACLSLLVGLLASGGFLVFDGVALHGAAILGYGLIWLAAFAGVGMTEEIAFRGYIQATLTRGLGFWPATVLTSLLFGLAHVSNHGESPLGLTLVVAAGLIFCLLLRATGSLWVGIGFHAAWDWAQSYLYGTPDSGLLARGHLLMSHAAGNTQLSGSAAGPEGSVLAAPVMLGGLFAVLWVCRQPGLRLARGAPLAAE